MATIWPTRPRGAKLVNHIGVIYSYNYRGSVTHWWGSGVVLLQLQIQRCNSLRGKRTFILAGIASLAAKSLPVYLPLERLISASMTTLGNGQSDRSYIDMWLEIHRLVEATLIMTGITGIHLNFTEGPVMPMNWLSPFGPVSWRTSIHALKVSLSHCQL